MKRTAASPGGFAQVGEWLKPADCKSAPPSEVRRFESFPVHQFPAPQGSRQAVLGEEVPGEGVPVNRLVLALVAYAVLGILAWTTLTDTRFRLATLFVLVMF